MKRIIFSLILCSIFNISSTYAKDTSSAFVAIALNESKGKTLIDTISKKVKKNKGMLVREFEILGDPRGNLKVDTLNKLYVLSFLNNKYKNRFLNDKAVIKKMEPWKKQNLIIISGKFLSPLSDLTGELYFLKISNYLSNDGKAQMAADEINSILNKRFGFYTDMAMKSNSIQSIKQADEIAIFFYKDAEMQKKFYADEELLSEIGGFNQKYLSSFVYLNLKLIK